MGYRWTIAFASMDIPLVIASGGGALSAFIAALGYHQQSRGLRAETDVRLARAFAELVPLANARGPGLLSEAAAGKLAEDDYPTADSRSQALNSAILTSPVGKQTQIAVLQVIASLGTEHPILWEAARAAVEEAPDGLALQKGAALKRLNAHRPWSWRQRAR